MKVLHINGAGSWGGNEQQLADLIFELDKLNVENIIMGRPGSPLHNHSKNSQITFIGAKDGKLSRKANYRYLKEVVKDVKPDVIHLHTSDAVTLFTISDLLYKLKTPCVFSKKGMGRSMSQLSILKYNYKNIHKIICVSEATKNAMAKEVLKRKNHKKLIVVYDGINVDRLKPERNDSLKQIFHIPEEKALVGNIANHAPAKDLPTLLKMMHHLVYNLNNNNVHLVQIGEFSGLTEELKNLQIQLKLEDHVTFTDFQRHATDFLPQFDVYVMSSEREGLPLTVYEAFYKKVPVASTKAGGIPEVIVDGQNGFLAEVKDFKTLAEKLNILLRDVRLQNRFREESLYLFRQKFEANVTAKETFNIYKNIAH